MSKEEFFLNFISKYFLENIKYETLENKYFRLELIKEVNKIKFNDFDFNFEWEFRIKILEETIIFENYHRLCTGEKRKKNGNHALAFFESIIVRLVKKIEKPIIIDFTIGEYGGGDIESLIPWLKDNKYMKIEGLKFETYRKIFRNI